MIRLLTSICLALLLGACSLTPRYEAQVASPAQGALVSGWMRWFPLLKVVIIDVDGLPRLGWDTQMPKALLIDPGPHTLLVRGLYIDFLVLGSADVELQVDLAPGRTYQLQIERQGRQLTIWLEDEAERRIVGNRASVTASIQWIIGGPGMHF